jgi:hypothetical protein
MRTILSLFLGVTLAFSAAQAQTSAPLVVQAVGSAATPAQPASAVQAAPANAAAGQSTLKLLQEMKAANDETLRKQQAALQAARRNSESGRSDQDLHETQLSISRL